MPMNTTVRWSALLLLAASSAFSQAGNGGNGDIDLTPMAINAPFTITVTGATGQAFFLFISDQPASIPIPNIGTVAIDITSPGFQLLLQGVIGAGGVTAIATTIPNDPALLNLLVFMQGVVNDPTHPSGVALTRAFRIDFENPDSFTSVPNLSAPRALGSGDLLNDGRVLVAGGGNGTLTAPVASNTSEIYQPYTRSWTAGPNMATQRAFHTSVVLPNGRVLVAGGTSTTGVVTNSCEIYDPVTNAFSAVAPMTSPRAGHAACLLDNGKVLVTGGVQTFQLPPGTTQLGPILNSAQDTGEVYDPALNTWTLVSNTMAAKRFAHSQTKLQNGQVLIVSGINGSQTVAAQDLPTFTNTCSLYNAATNSFASAATIPGPTFSTGRAGHRATLMPNGEVFVGGGVYSSLLTVFVPTAMNDARRYSPSTNAWASAGTLPAAVALQGQALLKNGKCHVAGGGSGTLLAFSAVANCATRVGGSSTFTNTNSLPAARGTQLTVRLWDGSVLICGGADATGTAIDTNLLYTPTP